MVISEVPLPAPHPAGRGTGVTQRGCPAVQQDQEKHPSDLFCTQDSQLSPCLLYGRTCTSLRPSDLAGPCDFYFFNLLCFLSLNFFAVIPPLPPARLFLLLHWVFVALHGLSPVAANRGYSWLL